MKKSKTWETIKNGCSSFNTLHHYFTHQTTYLNMMQRKLNGWTKTPARVGGVFSYVFSMDFQFQSAHFRENIARD